MDFIIISIFHSGTKFLCELLNRQPDLKCHLEIFNSDNINLLSDSNYPFRSQMYKRNNLEYQKFYTEKEKELYSKIFENNFHEIKFENPKYVLDLIKSYTPERKTGFKIMYPQFSEIESPLLSYIKQNKIKVIHYYRENNFARDLCRQKTQKSIKFPFIKKLNFDVQSYKNYTEKTNNNFLKTKNLLLENEIPYMELKYSSVAGIDQVKSMENVLEFIFSDKRIFYPTPKNLMHFQKRNIYPLDTQVENLEELKNLLKEDSSFLQMLNDKEY